MLALISIVCLFAMPLGARWTSIRMAEVHSRLPLASFSRAHADPGVSEAMSRAFADPAFDAALDRAILTVIYGAFASLLGVVLAVINVGILNYRAPWFWWALMGAAVLWMLWWGVPFGPAVGASAIIYLLWRRHTFRPALVGLAR